MAIATDRYVEGRGPVGSQFNGDLTASLKCVVSDVVGSREHAACDVNISALKATLPFCGLISKVQLNRSGTAARLPIVT